MKSEKFQENVDDERVETDYNIPVAKSLLWGIALLFMMACGGSEPRAVTITTNMGDITLEFYAEEAPKTVDNFVSLAQKGFYKDVIFHRVIPNFMIQGGDPDGTGTGGPGYSIEDEIGPSLKFDQAGILAMANSGRNTAGSQFFITVGPTPWLDGNYTIFGRVVKGQDVVDAISMLATNDQDRPARDVVIKEVKIHGSVPDG